MSDWRLIRRYAEEQSEEAFAQLTERYANLVYSTCRRELDDEQMAEDATQAVFLLLARKASTLRREVVLSGWLFQAARLTARSLRRQEARRRHAEGKAAAEMMRTEELSRLEANADTWGEIEPHLNNVIGSLRPQERDLLLMRFFEGHSLAEVGAALGLSEDAARMRVSRALEKMRRLLSRSGVAVSAAVLAGLLSTRAVRAAPPACAAAISRIGPVGSGAGVSVLALRVAQSLSRQGTLRLGWAAKAKGMAVIIVAGLIGVIPVAMVVGLSSGHSGGPAVPAAHVRRGDMATPQQTVMMSQSQLQQVTQAQNQIDTLMGRQLSALNHPTAHTTALQQQQAMQQAMSSLFHQQWVVTTKKVRLPNGKITLETSYSAQMNIDGAGTVQPPPGPDVSLVPGAKVLSVTTKTVPMLSGRNPPALTSKLRKGHY
jgi:RNA polymerase sigma factor (sigma-70 family)